MEIVVEVGNRQQIEQIKDELQFIEAFSKAIQPALNVRRVVVPADFDKTINELQNTTSYKSVRSHVAMAKIIELDDGITIILSPLLFTNGWDGQMRAEIYLHELVHVSNKRRFPQPLTQSPTTQLHFNTLYLLFDEYDANRKSFELADEIFPSKTPRFKAFIDGCFEGFFVSMVENTKDYDGIREEIKRFRWRHIDVGQFLANTKEYFDHASKDIVYTYSYIDHYSRFKGREPDLLKSKFVNDKTLALIDFFRIKYEKHDSDLLDGLDLFAEFLGNFGMRFEDRPEGLYCHVLDI